MYKNIRSQFEYTYIKEMINTTSQKVCFSFEILTS